MKPGGHGDHWHSVYSDRPREALIEAIRQTVRDTRARTGPQGLSAHYSPGGPLRTCVLVKRGSVVTAYPEVLGGPVWPVELREVIPWRNGVEGQIGGTCMGAAVSFFDTRYFAHHAKYRPGETYNFRMGALAYTLGPAEETEAETGEGVKVSFKGAYAYMPLSSAAGSDIDDYWFHSALEGGPAEARLNGVTLRGYPVILALPNEFEMALTLYAAPHALRPGIDTVQPGGDLEGALWLQGNLAAP